MTRSYDILRQDRSITTAPAAVAAGETDTGAISAENNAIQDISEAMDPEVARVAVEYGVTQEEMREAEHASRATGVSLKSVIVLYYSLRPSASVLGVRRRLDNIFPAGQRDCEVPPSGGNGSSGNGDSKPTLTAESFQA